MTQPDSIMSAEELATEILGCTTYGQWSSETDDNGNIIQSDIADAISIITARDEAVRNAALDEVFNEWMKGHTPDSWYNWLCNEANKRNLKTHKENTNG